MSKKKHCELTLFVSPKPDCSTVHFRWWKIRTTCPTVPPRHMSELGKHTYRRRLCVFILCLKKSFFLLFFCLVVCRSIFLLGVLCLGVSVYVCVLCLCLCMTTYSTFRGLVTWVCVLRAWPFFFSCVHVGWSSLCFSCRPLQQQVRLSRQAFT